MKKEEKMIIKNATLELKNLINNIKVYNNNEINEILFDIKSLKNNLQNMKITKDTSYIRRFLDQNTNNDALRNIISYNYEHSKSIVDEIVKSIDLLLINLEGNLSDKEVIKKIKTINKKFESSKYLFATTIEIFDTTKVKFKKNSGDWEAFSSKCRVFLNELKNYLVNFKDNYKFDLDEELNNYKAKIIQLCDVIYEPKLLTRKGVWFRDKIYRRFHKLKPTIAPDKIRFIDLFKKENMNKLTIKTYLFGTDERKGILSTILIYALLILFGFVYVYPILYMLGYSFMSVGDLANPNVNYVPTHLEYSNYKDAATTLDYWSSLGQSLLVSVIPAICQTISCSLVAWGLARYKFKGKKVLMGLVIFTFLIPSCLTMLPTVSLYAKLGLTGNVSAYILPALFGQGIKSTVFILIFYQYFRAIPKAIIEAAEIDGANDFVVFFRIALPTARSGILLTILLSIVWYYNETVLASVFFGSNIQTLPLGLENFKASFDAIIQGNSETGKTVNEAIYMAGTMLNILPLLLLYFFTQKYFIQGVDKAGITGE